jgi:hypothetical protein
MSTISVLTVQAGPPVPSGVTRASTALVVVDSAGASQSASLTGAESPPWTTSFTVAAGAGTITATDIDTNGATIGTTGPAAFATGAVGATVLQTSGVTVIVTTP